MRKHTVFIPQPIHEGVVEELREKVTLTLGYGAESVPLETGIQSADGVIVRLLPVTAELIDRAPRLKVIARHGVGVDNIDLATATRRRVAVVNTPGANAQAVAEHTFALMLAVARRVVACDRSIRQGSYRERDRFIGWELAGKRLGVVGLGRVGSLVARIARSFGMEVSGYDPYVARDGLTHEGVTVVDELDDLLAASDVVTLHLPLTSETQGLLGRSQLGRMRPGAILINVARGGIVDEAALVEVMQGCQLGGAALDVFSEEPLPPEHPLLACPNVIVTPHMGGVTEQAMYRMAKQASDGLLAVLRGECPSTVVNREVFDSASW